LTALAYQDKHMAVQQMFLADEKLWSTLKDLSAKCKPPRMIAVPYLGKDMVQSLSLGKDDVLICALTAGNAKGGSVSPDEIEKLQARGVRVFIQADLHAKIYLFDSTAVVCSANLSQSSENRLDEAGLLTRDPKVIRSIQKWFKDRMIEPVTPEWLEKCKAIYRPPRLTATSQVLKRSVWLINTDDEEYPEDEWAVYQAGCGEANTRLSNTELYCRDDVRWTGSDHFITSVQPGDLVICVTHQKDGTCIVSPHCRVLHLCRTKTKRGGPVAYLYIEIPRHYRSLKWAAFKKGCGTYGQSIKQTLISRKVPVAFERQVLALVSPEKLMIRRSV
jgi:hypothetical protein